MLNLIEKTLNYLVKKKQDMRNCLKGNKIHCKRANLQPDQKFRRLPFKNRRWPNVKCVGKSKKYLNKKIQDDLMILETCYLPNEVQHNIVSYCELVDLLNFGSACRIFFCIILCHKKTATVRCLVCGIFDFNDWLCRKQLIL